MKTVFTVYGGSVGADGSAQLSGLGAVVGTLVEVELFQEGIERHKGFQGSLPRVPGSAFPSAPLRELARLVAPWFPD
jgi:hypothetical protein